MNIKDRIVELLLAAYDRFMDWKSHGLWTRLRESEIPNITKVRRSE
ncbi:MAG: hypothetical protein L0287_14145 [Anaerolineae bacterium]|nr:hypothetical protein [Anaerolineae bacterium]